MKKKPKYWYNQSSVVPYRILNDQLEILLIRSRKNTKWIVPKGIVELGLSPMESAKKEALEEAGVNVSLGNNFLGSYSYKKWGGKCTVKVYAMEVRTVHDNWEEDFRERIWVNFNKIDEFIFSKKILRVISGKKLENFK